ncbi:hypothetical protein ACFW4K_09110 [Nocardiopsis alba]|uniref:hypothetical protein n=1 Tax=Nocardiopsis alba TaxID=53437 RepID=UPI003672AF66
MKSSKRILAPISLISVAGIVLTGCSSGPDGVYDFTRSEYLEPAPSVGIDIPDGLREAAGADAEGLLVSSAIAGSRELEGSQYCAIDLGISYTDDEAFETLTAPVYGEDEAAADVQEDIRYLSNAVAPEATEDLDTIKEDFLENAREGLQYEIDFSRDEDVREMSIEEYLESEAYDDRVEEFSLEGVDLARSVDGLAAQAVWDRYRSWTEYVGLGASASPEAPGTIDAAVQEAVAGFEEYRAELVEESAQVPEWENLSGPLGFDSPYSMEDFDEADLEEGSYFSDDLETVTVVSDCAKSSTDEDSLIPFHFPIETEDGIGTFASVDLTVMRNGDVSVADSEVDGYVVDANGDWITAG